MPHFAAMASPIKTITIRLPANLYARSAKTAKKKSLSLNSYVQQSLDAALRLEEDQALYDAFGRFGADKGGSDVGYAMTAQQEALLKHESPKTR
jgi:hypothetical protein